MPLKILVSAGEASGDRYAAGVVRAIRAAAPETQFFGCTGHDMRDADVETIVDSASLAVVGLVEVLHHLPRIYGEFRKLISAAERERPDCAILTDSPDFHLRVAKKLKNLGVPVFYLVAPQAWAWREGRVKQMRRDLRELHCIFPFEEPFFRDRGVNTHYIGHPLARIVRPKLSREAFFAKHRLPADRPLITLCPGSRKGEITRHLEPLRDAIERIQAARASTFVLAAPKGTQDRLGLGFLDPLLAGGRVRYIEGETWDALAHADVALPASGTVNTEAALLGTPMATYYRVNPVSWALGHHFLRVPFLSMVNLVAQKAVIPELIQDAMTGPALAAQALRLLQDTDARETMKQGLSAVRRALESESDPFEESARRILTSMNKENEK